ncbi:DUF1501 domain-containing protein [Ponticaulis sp.]|uniref:DUF1501 domain-containing protein n=1 Tax=Ponticaulis sp. TaxID=2020902 RepID=UPI0025FC6B10|nr:DUF1501 domain-containing protein [Ponticaulis sp.]
MKLSRRDMLRYAGAAGLSAASASGFVGALSSFQQASAAETDGYKALVCIFLFGGMDCNDTVLPYDQTSYDRYAEIRGSLLNQYEYMAGGSTRSRDRLLALNPLNGADFGTRQFALPEELSGIHGLFEQGRASIVGNVGPLIAPLTRDEYYAGSALRPKRLFSHNDQQSTWMANRPEGAQFGWGGRFADAAQAALANSNEEFTAISTNGNSVFLTGSDVQPYQLGTDGAAEFDILNQLAYLRNSQEGEAAYQRLRTFLEAGDYRDSHLIGRDVANSMSNALHVNEAYNEATQNAAELPVVFGSDRLGQQLAAVARTIQSRDDLGMRRQVFFVGMGGFDTHSGQASTLPVLHQRLDNGITSFMQVMDAFGLGDSVTLFTASDFGRTLAINGDGTDHGWGGHHFVVGDAVQGQTIFGDIPPYDFDHDADVGSGRLIPSVSVSQFAEPLGRWFGLSDAELAVALPDLPNFSAQSKLNLLTL